MLTALEQHFLVHHVYVPTAAHWLNGEHDSLSGGAGPDRATWMTDGKGVNYTMPGDKPPGLGYSRRLPWSSIREHVRHQPDSLVQELGGALDAQQIEARRHWDAMTAIDPHWYGGDPTNKPALDAEWNQHLANGEVTWARIHAVVLALLPLHDTDLDEPADLIEWAEKLA